ncbi:MAG: histidine kinase, partial [Coriobacteriales bacterium]|nr:histidine kinase [Coriobacteriales bacterium]
MDKLVLLLLCTYSATLLPFSALSVAAILTALSVSALFEVEIIPRHLRAVLLLCYTAVCIFLPSFLVFLPLLSYDCFRLHGLLPNLALELLWPLRLIWIIPLLVGFFHLRVMAALLLILIGALACFMAWRSDYLATTLTRYRSNRDQLSTAFKKLESKNRDLEERQSLELRLATLAERNRIAREIHDNVGHLLTRSILQMEALQVMQGGSLENNTDNPRLSAQFGSVANGSGLTPVTDGLTVGSQQFGSAANGSGLT